MTQAKKNPKAGMNRGAKALLASLSITTTLGGWAWLSLTQPPAPVDDSSADQPDPVQATDAPTIEVLNSISGVGNVDLQPLATSNVPNIANLPVRGLRHVGDATPTAQMIAADTPYPTPQPQQQQQQTNNGSKSGGGGPQPSNNVQPPPKAPKPPPPPPPPPPPKPRKTRSSK